MAKFRLVSGQIDTVKTRLRNAQRELDAISGELGSCAGALSGESGFGIEEIRGSIRSCARAVGNQEANTRMLEAFLARLQEKCLGYEVQAARKLEETFPQGQSALWQVFPWAIPQIAAIKGAQADPNNPAKISGEGSAKLHEPGVDKNYHYDKDKGKWVEDDPDDSDGSKVEWEIKAGLEKEVEGDVLHGELGSVGDFHDAGISGGLLSGAASGFAGIIVNQGETMIGLQGKVEGHLAKGEAHAAFGTDSNQVKVSAEGSVGTVEAEGKFGAFIEDGETYVGAKGEAGAYLAKGEVKGSFTILGIEIGASLEGNVGVGAQGELSYNSDDGFTFGLGASAGVGGGFKINIDPSKAIESIGDAIRGLTSWW